MCLSAWSVFFFFFKQKTAYEMRISDWSSDVCSSDLEALQGTRQLQERLQPSSSLRTNLGSSCSSCLSSTPSASGRVASSAIAPVRNTKRAAGARSRTMASACGPSKPGMLTSESTSRGAGPSSADSSEASLSTRTHSASMPAWRSSIIASSASSALSSTSTTRQRAAALPATGAASEILRRLVEHRSDEHTSELQSLMRISYAVFCLKKTTQQTTQTSITEASNDKT